jgi:hypothetical protein
MRAATRNHLPQQASLSLLLCSLSLLCCIVSLGAEPPRSPHWPAVERAFKAAHPVCECCGKGLPDGISIQVHHCIPFDYCVQLGRPDLELDPRNLVALCETTKGHPADNHHLLLGHANNFRAANLDVREDCAKFKGMSVAEIKASARWEEILKERLMPLEEMGPEERVALRAHMDRELPPDKALCAKYGIVIKE